MPIVTVDDIRDIRDIRDICMSSDSLGVSIHKPSSILSSTDANFLFEFYVMIVWNEVMKPVPLERSCKNTRPRCASLSYAAQHSVQGKMPHCCVIYAE